METFSFLQDAKKSSQPPEPAVDSEPNELEQCSQQHLRDPYVGKEPCSWVHCYVRGKKMLQFLNGYLNFSFILKY